MVSWPQYDAAVFEKERAGGAEGRCRCIRRSVERSEDKPLSCISKMGKWTLLWYEADTKEKRVPHLPRSNLHISFQMHWLVSFNRSNSGGNWSPSDLLFVQWRSIESRVQESIFQTFSINLHILTFSPILFLSFIQCYFCKVLRDWFLFRLSW